jgi:glycosyltransferase involved in cell wall biosynthesis
VKRVLVVTYHFPPLGGSGVQRATKFVRYLPEHGFEPVVLTGSGGEAHVAAPDQTLAEELPTDLEVLRVPGPEPGPSRGRRARAERWLRLTTPWSRWWVEGANEVGRRVREIDLVFVTMSPFQSVEVAETLARRLGVPWVADLRDPWVLDEMQVYETRLHRALDMRRMRRSLGSAAAVVMNTADASVALGDAFPELAGRVHTIPNGFDAADFEGMPPARTDSAFRIVHSGVLHTEQGHEHRQAMKLRRIVGGAIGDVDILPRSHVFLLEALERVVAADPSLRGVLELHLLGRLTPGDRAAAQSELVHEHGYLSHREAVDFVRTADLLFLPMHEVAPGYRARLVPGKTYEYLASGRPVLAAVPAGDARDLLAASGNARLCAPTDVGEMAQAVASEVARFRAEGRSETRPVEGLEAYERRLLTARLADVLDAILGEPKRPASRETATSAAR